MDDASAGAPGPRSSPLAQNVGLALGGVFCAVIAVAAVRWRGEPVAAATDNVYAGIYRYSPDPDLGVELVPGANGIVNAEGYVGPVRPAAKPPGAMRIVGLGDSVTFYYAPEGLAWLERLEEALPAVAGAPVEVVNLAIGGLDTRNEARRLELTGLALDPDLVLLGYCVNDAVDFGFLLKAVARPDVAPRFDGFGDVTDGYAVQLGVREGALAIPGLGWRGLFDRYIAPAERWRASRRGLERIAELTRPGGVPVVVAIFPALIELDDYYLAPLHEAVAAEAARHGFGVVDLLPAFRGAPFDAVVSSPGVDAIHPSPEGNRVAAEAVLAWLREHRPWEARAGRAAKAAAAAEGTAPPRGAR